MTHTATFKPAWWLPGPHLQTLWPVLCRRRPRLRLRRERLELPDGDFLDLAWTPGERGPIVLILHGLEGSSDSVYVSGLLQAVVQRGWRGVVLHFRGCSGEPNRQAASYNAGQTCDLDYVIRLLRRREPLTPIACVGYSLGGNALLKWLGETGTDAPIQAAVAVSVPFRLELAVQRLNRGFSRLYQTYLLRQLRCHYRRKIQLQHQFPLPFSKLIELRNFHEFDSLVTAPLHGYADATDYYHRASCRPYLKRIRIDTLILHALDDPFMVPAVVPQAAELADSITLELSPGGGHVGFVTGSLPWRAGYWLEQRIPLFLAERFSPAGTATGQTSRL